MSNIHYAQRRKHMTEIQKLYSEDKCDPTLNSLIFFPLPAQYVCVFLPSHLHSLSLNLALCFGCQARRKEWLLCRRDGARLLCFFVAAAELSTGRLGR